MSRVSFKKVEETASLLVYEVIKHQELGNRKNYYYVYSLIMNDNYVLRCVTLKNIEHFLLNKCKEIVGV